MPSKPSRDRLPFEPRQKKKKKPKKNPNTAQATAKSVKTEPVRSQKSAEASLSAIPDAVSKRMLRRMLIFSGVPTFFGVSSFFIFYALVKQGLFELPPIAVLLVSMGFFGLGVLGLSYGVISTSWDENRLGSWWGGEEFKINLGRITEAWRSSKKEAKKS